MSPARIHFVTGRLAEHALRNVLADLAPRAGFDYTIDVLKISVAALMSAEWLVSRVRPPPQTDRVIVPGYCRGNLGIVRQALGVAVELGPKDLRDLPEFFGNAARPADYGNYDIQILAEINHAPRLSLDELLAQATALKADGADIIDVGCEPGQTWSGVGDAVRALVDAGHRVSIDSYEPAEIGPAVRAGAELVLSVNSSNREAAPDWGCEVVVVPDQPSSLVGLDESIEFLARHQTPFRIDPILDPIAFGFAASLGRYLEVRSRWPDAEMLMGIGNITELTDCDSAGVNAVLLGFCQELGIRSVLTTQVIPWAQSSVKECDLARRLMHHAVRERVLPKRVDPRLVLLRDAKVRAFGEEQLDLLASAIKDFNFRIFAEGGRLHLLGGGQHWSGDDPFELFAQALAASPKPIDARHAFYLGYELCKAVTALTLGKQYQQDQSLDWGFLTREETSHRGPAENALPANPDATAPAQPAEQRRNTT